VEEQSNPSKTYQTPHACRGLSLSLSLPLSTSISTSLGRRLSCLPLPTACCLPPGRGSWASRVPWTPAHTHTHTAHTAHTQPSDTCTITATHHSTVHHIQYMHTHTHHTCTQHQRIPRDNKHPHPYLFELCEGPPAGRDEQRLPAHGVVERDLAMLVGLWSDSMQET
jgi:hypothetical protein